MPAFPGGHGDIYQLVLEYDHGGPMPGTFTSPQNFYTPYHHPLNGCVPKGHLAHRFGRRPPVGEPARYSSTPFSGSVGACLSTLTGVGLFLLTYGYFVGKPLYDAHMTLWNSRRNDSVESCSGSDRSVTAMEAAGEENRYLEGSDRAPIEEWDDD